MFYCFTPFGSATCLLKMFIVLTRFKSNTCSMKFFIMWHGVNMDMFHKRFAQYRRCVYGRVWYNNLYGAPYANMYTYAMKCVQDAVCQCLHVWRHNLYIIHLVYTDMCQIWICSVSHVWICPRVWWKLWRTPRVNMNKYDVTILSFHDECIWKCVRWKFLLYHTLYYGHVSYEN